MTIRETLPYGRRGLRRVPVAAKVDGAQGAVVDAGQKELDSFHRPRKKRPKLAIPRGNGRKNSF